METIENFLNWFNNIGGSPPKLVSPYLREKFVEHKPFVSSFKERAQEIKDRYNHRFRHDSFLKDIPADINNLYFDKK